MAEPLLKRTFVKANISSRLKCPICYQVLAKPRRLYCGHTFCKPCLKQLFKPHKNPEHVVSCPLCRSAVEVDKIGHDLIAQKIIQQLQVFCPVSNCSWKGQNQLLQTHYHYECRMRKYLKQYDQPTTDLAREDHAEQQDSVTQRINQNVSRGSLIARVVCRDHPQLIDSGISTTGNSKQKKIQSKQLVNRAVQTEPTASLSIGNGRLGKGKKRYRQYDVDSEVVQLQKANTGKVKTFKFINLNQDGVQQALPFKRSSKY